MANGLFSGGGSNAQMTQLLLQKERQDRIQQAGAGLDPLVAAAARATQGMRESVGDIAGGVGGMLTGQGRRLDPRMEASVKLDKDRDEILEKIKEYASDDDINEQEMREGFSLLASKGYMKEAKEFLAMAQSMRKLDLEEKKIKGTSAAALAKANKQTDVPAGIFTEITSKVKNKMGWASMFKEVDGQAVFNAGSSLMGKGAQAIQEELSKHQLRAQTIYVNTRKAKGQAAAMKAVESYIGSIASSASTSAGGGGSAPLPPGFVPR
tara:strand:- start:726 stop:1523 length:798 start_codon:yes stop_codon:yes gene_type:complete